MLILRGFISVKTVKKSVLFTTSSQGLMLLTYPAKDELLVGRMQGIPKSFSDWMDSTAIIVTSYERLKNRLQAENISISDTTVRPRKDTYLFDFDSVNEAIINALVHNDWTITEPQISMFQDRLEILSHGGLPSGMSETYFFEGISKPRNATLMRIFLTMGLAEHTGHGIPTIINRYGKDVFEIEANYIRCVIPFDKQVLSQLSKGYVGLIVGLSVGLNKTEKNVLQLLIENPSYNADELAEKVGVTKRTIERSFASLQKKGLLERTGSKRDGSWIVIRSVNEK